MLHWEFWVLTGDILRQNASCRLHKYGKTYVYLLFSSEATACTADRKHYDAFLPGKHQLTFQFLVLGC